MSDAAAVVVAVGDEPLTSEVAAMLIAALNAELTARYPNPEDNFLSLDPDEVGPGRGAFVVARDGGGTAIGCGAVRVLEPGLAEVKRMYVAPPWRGRRVAARLLSALTARAVDLGVARLVLETGDRSPEAIAVYERAGFRRIPRFGPYVDAVHSVCMELRLDR